MRRIKILLILAVMMFYTGCGLETEETACSLCTSPPRSYVFELIDKTTGENLFTNGTFNPLDIDIESQRVGRTITHSFLDEDDINLIVINSIGWQTEIVDIVLKVGDVEILSLYVDAVRKTEDCCSFTEYNESRIENAEYTYDQTLEIYSILIE